MFKRIAAVFCLVAMMSGCASAPSQDIAQATQFNDPATTPVENWSFAMKVFKAMGYEGQKDISASEAARLKGLYNGLDVAATSVGVGGQGGGSVMFGLALLSGGTGGPQNIIQVVSWVPEELAASPDEASALALKAFKDAREKVFQKRTDLLIRTGAFGNGSSRSFTSSADAVRNNPVQISAGPEVSPAFIKSSRSYGPIFIRDHQLTVDSYNNNLAFRESFTQISRELPDWMFIYHPGNVARKPYSHYSLQSAVFNKGSLYQFVEN